MSITDEQLQLSAIKRSVRNKLDDLISKCDEKESAAFAQEMKEFESLLDRWLSTKGKMIDWNKIQPPNQGQIIEHGSLADVEEPKNKELLHKLCVLKLNGGLGTTMGCRGPKSIIEVRSEMSFLDLTVQQIEYLNQTYNSDVPLLLMNSFNTHEDTEKIIHKYKHTKATLYNFNQSRYPRIYKENFLPVPDYPSDQANNKEPWYPPGHGDVFMSLMKSGLLEQLIQMGREYVFISNVDNLGATVDFKILNYLVHSGCEYAMEVTDKTRNDIKGGTLIDYEGRTRLLEIAQVPPSKVDEFKSIKKFKFFNTNNLWVNLKAIQRVLKAGALNEIDIITNTKKMDNGAQVIQLETAAGAAIQCFKGGIGINVKRSRFLPVKSCSDLLVVQSNLYELQNGTLRLNPRRVFPSVPLVTLGDSFRTVSQYNSRMNGIPDILELDQLTVSGDVTFGANITLKGTVIIVANHGARIDIPLGSILENKVVSGNLRILEH